MRGRALTSSALPILGVTLIVTVGLVRDTSPQHWVERYSITSRYDFPALKAALLKDGVVAALPRRHRNVPRRWCLRPLSGKDGNHDRSYNDRSRSGKECFPGARRVNDGGAEVP